ncbi:hypothetical protein CV093_10265 [Oceanobacillus sp. 143]|nr:hypothetical protein CV093_10265 [Oceanobacillus sp. 143]
MSAYLEEIIKATIPAVLALFGVYITQRSNYKNQKENLDTQTRNLRLSLLIKLKSDLFYNSKKSCGNH